MSQNRLLPTPSALDSASTQFPDGFPFSSLLEIDTIGQPADLLIPAPYLPNLPFELPRVNVCSTQQGVTSEYDLGRKRRRLEFVKCDYCRKDKQKCLPIGREPGQKCIRCVDKDFPCSEGKRAPRKSRRAEVTTGQLSAEPFASPKVLGLEIEDWAFLVGYRTIMIHALESVQRLKAEMNSYITDEPDPEDRISSDADYIKFERFFATLSDVVLRGVQKLGTEPLHQRTLMILTTMVAQSISSNVRSHNDSCPKGRLEKEHMSDTASHNAMGTFADRFLAVGRRFKLAPKVFDDCSYCKVHHIEGSNYTLLFELSDRVHTKASDILKRLQLWDSLPSTMRKYASFIPEELEYFIPALDVEDLISEPRDCLGRYPLLRHLDCSEHGHDYLWCFEESELAEVSEAGEDILQKLNMQDILGRTALHLACQKGYSELVSKMLHVGASPWLNDITGRLPLHYAAAEGSIEICSLLLAMWKENVIMEDNLKNSPLDYAVSNRHYATAICLVRSGIFDVNRTSGSEGPLLEHALRFRARDLVECLLDHGADPSLEMNKYAFTEAIHQRNCKAMRRLGQHPGTIVDARHHVWGTPLWIAARSGFVDGVIYLSSRSDVDVNFQDNLKMTPLMAAAQQGNQEVANILIKLPRTNLSLQDFRGRTAADMSENEEITRMINEEILRRKRESDKL